MKPKKMTIEVRDIYKDCDKNKVIEVIAAAEGVSLNVTTINCVRFRGPASTKKEKITLPEEVASKYLTSGKVRIG